MASHNRPSLTTDAVVLCGRGDDMKLLVVERRAEPFQGQLSLPGGFVEEGELSWKAALRELREETELEMGPAPGIPLSLREKKGRDPRGWTLSIPYLFWSPEEKVVSPADDAGQALWVKLKDLESLSFDHGAILCEALGYFWRIPVLGGQNSTSPLLFPFFYPPGVSSQEWILYPGSFNPWHQGHEACLKAALPYAPVMVIPDQNPQKDKRNSHFCSFQYFRELQKKISPVGLHMDLQNKNQVVVYPGFCGRERSNPTYQWWPRSQSPQQVFSLLVGDDSFAQIHQWLHATDFISRLQKIYLVPRNHSVKAKEIESVERSLKKINPELQLVFLPDHPHKDLSSTKIRGG